jgi:hypothetical protein
MNGKKAKKLRKLVYNEMSTKPKEYEILRTIKKLLPIKNHKGEMVNLNIEKNTVVNKGLRRKYQELKNLKILKIN